MYKEEEKSPESKGFLKSRSKLTFLLGLFIGISVISTLGFLFTLAMLVNGNVNSTTTTASNDGYVAGEEDSAVPSDNTADAQAAANVEQVVDVENAYIRGNADAPITLIEFSDFECPYSARHQETIVQILDEYPNQVKLIYKHFPLSFHANAQKAAEAAECAGEQGKFWEMHDLLYVASDNKELSVDKFKELAQELKLDTNQFNTCLDDGKYADQVAKDTQEGIAAGVEGTPGTYVNGTLISGAVPFESFKTIIDAAL